MSYKRAKEFERLIARETTAEVERHTTNGARITFELIAPNRDTRKFVIPSSAGDPRADKNELAAIKRWADANKQKLEILLAQPAVGVALAAAIEKSPPESTTTVNEQTKREQPNRLTHKQAFQLADWVRSFDLAGIYTPMALALKATEVLGFSVAAGSATAALDTVERELPKAPAAEVNPRDRAFVIAKHLAALLEELGKPVPDDLGMILKKIPLK